MDFNELIDFPFSGLGDVEFLNELCLNIINHPLPFERYSHLIYRNPPLINTQIDVNSDDDHDSQTDDLVTCSYFNLNLY